VVVGAGIVVVVEEVVDVVVGVVDDVVDVSGSVVDVVVVVVVAFTIASPNCSIWRSVKVARVR
jgi:hypothetical protein